MAVWQCTVYHLVTAPSAWGAVHRTLQLRCVLTWMWITYTSYSAVRESLGSLDLPTAKEGRFSGQVRGGVASSSDQEKAQVCRSKSAFFFLLVVFSGLACTWRGGRILETDA